MVARFPVRLQHSVMGDHSSPAVVLLHGFPLNRSMWMPQAEALVKAGARVVLPDLRGHGLSEAPDAPATMEGMAREVFDLVSRLGIREFALGGFSLGGYVALEMYAQRTSWIKGLLLVDTRAEPDSDEAKRARKETAAKVQGDGIGVLVDSMMPQLLTERTRQERKPLAKTVEAMIRSTPPVGAANALLGMADRPDRRPLLPKIRVPSSIVVGKEDTLTPPSSAHVLSDGIRGSALVEIAAAAHLTPLEAPEIVNAAAITWYARVLRNARM